MGQQSGSLSPPPDGSAHRKEVSSRRDARKETTELLLLWSLRGTFCCSGCQPLNLLRTAESSSSRSSCWNFLLQQLARLYVVDGASRVAFSPYASIFILYGRVHDKGGLIKPADRRIDVGLGSGRIIPALLPTLLYKSREVGKQSRCLCCTPYRSL